MGEHRFRNLPAILPGKGEVFMADPRLLVIEHDFNCRDMESAETLAHIDWLADEIEAQGFNPEMPLTVRRRGDDAIVVRGHCRHAACMKLIEKGVELLKIPVMQIASGTSDIDLIFDQEASNYGLRLDPLARARLVLRARRMGVKDEEIARRMHWKSTASIKQHLEMLGTLPEPVKEQVRGGDISATEAMKVVKNLPAGTDPVEAAKIIAANKEENARIKGKDKSHKVTAKTLARDRPKAPPKPEPVIAAPITETIAAPIHEPVGEAQVAFSPLSDETPPPPPPAPEVHEQLKTVAAREFPAAAFQPPSTVQQLNADMFGIVAKLATYAEQNDLSERGDDDVIEVPVWLLKRAWELNAKLTGDTAEAA